MLYNKSCFANLEPEDDEDDDDCGDFGC